MLLIYFDSVYRIIIINGRDYYYIKKFSALSLCIMLNELSGYAV